MVKKVDVAVFDVAQALHDGKPMHGHVVFGLKDGAIGLTDFEYTEDRDRSSESRAAWRASKRRS